MWGALGRETMERRMGNWENILWRVQMREVVGRQRRWKDKRIVSRVGWVALGSNGELANRFSMGY